MTEEAPDPHHQGVAQEGTVDALQEQLALADARLRTLLEAGIIGVIVAGADGAVLEANDYYLELIGFSREEFERGEVDWRELTPPEWLEADERALAELRERGACTPYEKEYLRRDGSRVAVLLVDALLPGPAGHIVAMALDATERKRVEEEREITVRLLQLLSSPVGLDELIRGATGLLREVLGLDAVGVRLRDGDDYPYFETAGFPAEFVRLESSLCRRDEDGEPRLDSDGSPSLECMCGNVLCGRFNPARPFFTARGSFWTNSTTELLGSTSDSDRLAGTRNRCHGEGFESVALIALRVGDTTHGLLQLNDRRRDRFSPQRMVLLERLADKLAIAIAHRLASAELEDMARQRQLALDAARMGWWHYDPATKVATYDRRYTEIFGVAGSERPNEQILGLLHPDDLPRVWAAVEAALDPEVAAPYSAQYRINRPDGSQRWVEAHGSAVFSGEGAERHATALIGTAADITERKQAELALQRSEASARTLNRQLHTLQQAVTRLASARTVADVMAVARSAARQLAGADGASFVLRDGDHCFYADEDAIQPLWKGQRFPMDSCVSGWVMRHRESLGIEDIFADPRVPADVYRPTFVASLAMVPIRSAEPLGALGAYWATRHRPADEEMELLTALADAVAVAMENVRSYDLLEQRVAERTAELRAANQELDAFTYAVSHDLRAPLRALSGFSRALEEDYGEALQGEAREFLDHIDRASRHMGELIDGLLRLSRSTRGELRRDQADLSAMAERILGQLAAAEPDRRVAWQVEPGLTASGDARMLELVLDNLLGNAWKYTAGQPAAEIRVAGRCDESGTTLEVADNGAGFDMRFADKLFQPFQRLHRQDEFEGLGIGLATVQRILRRHGGEIEATGAPGEGATFHIHVPRPRGHQEASS